MLQVLALTVPMIVHPANVEPVTTNYPIEAKRGVIRVTADVARTTGAPFDERLTLCPSTSYTYRYRAGVCPAPASPVVTRPGVNGAVAVLRGVQSGLTIGPARVAAGVRAMESDEGSSLRDTRITRLTGIVERDGIRLREARDVVIERFNLRMRDEPQTGSNLPEGIAIATGRNITIRDGMPFGFRMVPTGGYTNGDGIATELATSGTITSAMSRGHSDAAFDLKGYWRLDGASAYGSFRGYRIWGSAVSWRAPDCRPPSQRVIARRNPSVRL